MRYETPFIIEWVAWHRMLGFDVMVADNNTEGRQSELLKKLDVARIIRRFDVTGIRVMPQIPAYHAMFHAALDAGYSCIGFLDADEFFEPFESGDVRGSGARLIKNMFSDTAAAAIGFNWMVFGSSGHTKPSDDLVTDRFTKSAQKDFGLNRCFKSFPRSGAMLRHLRRPEHVRRDAPVWSKDWRGQLLARWLPYAPRRERGVRSVGHGRVASRSSPTLRRQDEGRIHARKSRARSGRRHH